MTMKRSRKMIVSLSGIAVLAAAVTATFVLLGAGPSVAPRSAQAAVTPAVAASLASAQPAASAAEPTVLVSADFAVSYNSFGQLKQAADVIVRGQVTDVSYVDFNSSAFTKLTLQVAKCFKGDAAVGDSVTIIEVGGITSLATIKGDKFGPSTAEDANTKVKVLLDGAPLTQVGDNCVYFLAAGSIGVVSGEYYVPLGAFQGRFNIGNGVAKRFVPNDWQGSKYTSLATDDDNIDSTLAQVAAQ
jgi:hypothetical protein